MMLSKKAEQFLVELRLYLISKGKNDQEMNEILEELEVHLMEAEAEGKDVTHIIGESPKQYMKNIGEAISTDYLQNTGLILMMLFLIAAYFSIGPAIEGVFSLSKSIIMMAVLGGFMGLVIYGLLLFRWFPKLFHSRWLGIIGFLINIGVIIIGVALLLWNQKQGFKPFFVATPVQNNLILLLCVIIFVSSSIFTKTWINILIPVFISLGPIANRFIPDKTNHNLMYILYTFLGLIIITAVVIFIVYRKRKGKSC